MTQLDDFTTATSALLGTKADVVHTHTSADITDFVPAVQALIPAAPAPVVTSTSVTVVDPSVMPFDGGQFTGTDSDKWTQVLAWLAARGNGPRPDLLLPARALTVTLPIPTWAGLRMVGGRTPAREFGSGPTLIYAGPSGTSLFTQQQNSGYGYPANGVVRDMSFDGIQFQAANDRDLFPTVTAWDSSKVEWFVNFNNCGFVGWRHLLWGYGDGFTVTGLTHLQGGVDTAFKFGGSENVLFGDGSLIDSAQAAWLTAGKPFIEMTGSKWTIGGAMISARNSAYQLLVSGGDSGRCIGTYFDAPDSAPTSGAQVRVTGGDGLSLVGCNFKGGHGVSVTGGTSVNIIGCTFDANAEVLTIASTFTGRVKMTGCEFTKGTPKVIKVAKLSQVQCLDADVTIQDLSGNILRAGV